MATIGCVGGGSTVHLFKLCSCSPKTKSIYGKMNSIFRFWNYISPYMVSNICFKRNITSSFFCICIWSIVVEVTWPPVWGWNTSAQCRMHCSFISPFRHTEWMRTIFNTIHMQNGVSQTMVRMRRWTACVNVVWGYMWQNAGTVWFQRASLYNRHHSCCWLCW